MSQRLLTPADAAAVIAKRLDDSWAERVCAEALGEPESPVVCPLRPGVNGTADIERLSHQAWTAWRMAWREIDFAAGLTGERGITCERREITVAGVCAVQPHRLTVATLADGIEAVRRLSGGSISPSTDFGQARAVAAKCLDAGIALTPSVLKAVHRLPDPDFDVAIGVVGWLRRHSDL